MVALIGNYIYHIQTPRPCTYIQGYRLGVFYDKCKVLCVAHHARQVMTNTYVVRKRLKKILFRSKQLSTQE